MLVVDIGNSRVKWAAVDSRSLKDPGAANYSGEALDGLLDDAWRDLPPPASITYCSVGASASGDVFERWVRQRWSLDCRRVHTAANGFGVRCAYARPEALGADRWAALVACWHKYARAACIVDCGTAITVDAISERGEHLGGVILPGVVLMRHALTCRAEGIPAEVSKSRDVFAKSTADGVAAGTLYAAAAAVDRVVAEMEASLPAGSARILTGGDMEVLEPFMATAFGREPHLVLHGLAVIGGALE
jgi:type III pantothenate kinase